MDNLEVIRYSTLRVLADFEADNARYIELRTTPRQINQHGISKRTYVEIVLDAIREYCSDPAHRLRARLILSVDRRETFEQASETVDIALDPDLRRRGIVGVDLCGNPLRLNIKHLLPAFRKAKEGGLKLTIHFAETRESASDEELGSLLDLKPDRLGHVIHVKEEFRRRIIEESVGVELCLSCNVKSGLTTEGYAKHHFGWWSVEHDKVALCVSVPPSFTDSMHDSMRHV